MLIQEKETQKLRCNYHAKMTRQAHKPRWWLNELKDLLYVGAVFLHNRFPLLLWEIITQILGKNGSLKSPSAILHGCAKLPAMIIAPLCPFGHSNHAWFSTTCTNTSVPRGKHKSQTIYTCLKALKEICVKLPLMTITTLFPSCLIFNYFYKYISTQGKI